MVSENKARRGAGEGSVYQDKNGTWKAVLDLGVGINGKRKRIKRTAKTRQLAIRALTDLKVNEINQEIGSNQKVTFDYLAKKWIEVGISERVRQSTANGYVDIYNRYIKQYLGRKKLSEIDVNVIDEWLIYLGKQGMSASTRKRARQTCGAIFKFAIKKRLAFSNPVADSQSPKAEQNSVSRVQPPLSLLEATQYLRMFKATEIDSIVHLALYTGMRRGEIVGLDWSDISFEDKTLSINKTAVESTFMRPDGSKYTKLVLNPPKTAHSKRKIPITEPVLHALKRQQIKQRKQKLKAGKIWKETDAIFTTELGTRMFPSNVYHMYSRSLKNSELRYVRFHDLRHTVAVLALDSEVPLEQISRLLGHSTISVTMDIYGKSVQSLVDRGAYSVAEILETKVVYQQKSGAV
jgi:integrase